MTKIYSFQISIILVSLILPSTVLSYEPYFNWHIRIYRYNSFTQKEAQLYTLKFRDIYAYSDSIYDLPLLKYSNRARAVNPDNQLREISAKKGWEVIERAT